MCSCDRINSNSGEIQFCKAAAPTLPLKSFSEDDKPITRNEIQKFLSSNCEEVTEKEFESRITDTQRQIINHIPDLQIILKDEEINQWATIQPFHNKKLNFYFKGKWSDKGERCGLGKIIKEDGSLYYGFFSKDKFEGSGLYITLNGEYYWGTWRDDKTSGEGRLVVLGGKSVYKGQWFENKKHGIGEETFSDGSSYIGEYKNNQMEGQGSYTWADKTKYIGEFLHSMLHGQGLITWADSRTYKGEFLFDKMHGNGRMTWPNGSYFEGEYKHGLKSGQGTFYWNNEKSYSGNWVDNKQHGAGILKIKDKIHQGIWRFGEIIKLRETNPEIQNVQQEYFS